MSSIPLKSESHRPNRGNLTITDGLILVASCAVILAWQRILPPIRFRSGSVWYAIAECYIRGIPFFFILSVTILVLQFRHPRTTRIALLRDPGFRACLYMTFGTTTGTFLIAGTTLLWHIALDIPIKSWPPYVDWPLLVMFFSMSLLILVDRLIEAARQIERSEPDWMESTARVLGRIWMCLLLMPLLQDPLH